MNNYLFDCPLYLPISAFSESPSLVATTSVSGTYDASECGLYNEEPRFDSATGYFTTSSSEALPNLLGGYAQQTTPRRQYPGPSYPYEYNYTYDSQDIGLGLADDPSTGPALADEYDPFGFNTNVSVPGSAFGSPVPSSVSSVSPRSSISSTSSSKLANYDGHIGSNALPAHWSDSSSSCSSSPASNDRLSLSSAPYSQGQIYAPQPVHPQVQAPAPINTTTSLRLVEGNDFSTSLLYLHSQPPSRPSTGAPSASYGHHLHHRRSEPYALASSFSRARHGVHPIQPINAQSALQGKPKPSATETPAGKALSEKERKEREREERRRSKDGRVKAHRCPHAGCTKAYLNPNGLKYHLEKGSCTTDPAFVPISAVLSSQASAPVSRASSHASSPAASKPAPGITMDTTSIA